MFKRRITDFKMDYAEHTGLACTAPCSMYSVLLKHGLIEDPYYRDNEIRLRDLARRGCTFTAEFEVNEPTLAQKFLLLRFHGLDTLCHIELNGTSIAHTDNMHRTYTFDVKGILKKGTNVLRLEFSSAVLEMERLQSEHYLAHDSHCTPGHSHLRKAFFMSGWDWAPTLPDMGIFRDIELLAFDTKMIERVEIKQIHGEDSVRLELLLHTIGEDDMSRAVASLVSPGGNVYYCGFLDNKGVIEISKPNLWWPNGLGTQNLYRLSVNLYSDAEIVDSKEMRIGLRTLTVSREPDEYGEEFALTVNGVKFFAMGSNYVPEDSILPEMSRERTRRLLTDAKRANFNTMRVWGGAFYPHDYFYELCDELGLVVWQDFMVACGNIRMTDKNRENFIAEFKDNFTRIAHHPCLGIVSGNNEMEEFITYSSEFDGEEVRRDYLELYENILPALMKEYLPDTFYWPSTPSSGGNFNLPRDETRGDCHYWAPWGGGAPYEECRNHYFRFMSEFGFESIPSIKTVRAFTEEDDRNIFSPVMEWHQKKKRPDGTKAMISYASDKYRYANEFGDLAYVTQLVQADAVRYTVEHMRRHRGRCMGSIYWQFNDCWPVCSWSSVDYFGRWKALHYYAKRFYAPVLISAHEDGTRVTFSLSNERRKIFDGTFTYSVIDASFNLLFKDSFPISAPEMSASDILTADLTSLVKGREDECVLVYSVTDGEGAKSEGTLLFTVPKSFRFKKPTITPSISGVGTDYTITLTSDAYARSVELDFDEIDAVFENNYFDITDSSPIRIHFTTSTVTNAETLSRELSVRTVYDVGRG